MGKDAPNDDPALEHFRRYLDAERNASIHTLSNYFMDIRQFVSQQWGAQAKPPFRWKEVDRFAARRFLVSFQKAGSQAATTRRKLSSLRAFFRFLVREEYVQANPFGAVVMPKLPKRLPEVLSREEVKRLLEAPFQEKTEDGGRKAVDGGQGAEGGRQSTVDSGRKEGSGKRKDKIWDQYARARDAAILEVLYSSGMRVSELGGLNDSNVDILSGVAKVRGKGKKERLCPLGGPACRELRKAMELRDLLWAGMGRGGGRPPCF